MKDEDLKLEEIEVSLTLGGSGEVDKGEGRGEGVNATLMSYTLKIHQSQGRRYHMSGWVGCDNR